MRRTRTRTRTRRRHHKPRQRDGCTHQRWCRECSRHGPGTYQEAFHQLHQLKLARRHEELGPVAVGGGVVLGACEGLCTLHRVEDVADCDQAQICDRHHEDGTQEHADLVERPRDAKEATTCSHHAPSIGMAHPCRNVPQQRSAAVRGAHCAGVHRRRRSTHP